jgi:segregation and condensation protein A
VSDTPEDPKDVAAPGAAAEGTAAPDGATATAEGTAAATATAAAEPAKVETELESVLPKDVPQIRLPIFEGPLDLLLYLLRKEKVDIHDIPIAPITRQYMEYLDVMKELNLELAGEFMVMAATLIHIKSKMLVPLEPTEAEGEEDYVDPREELVQRLLEFQKYKEAAGLLHQKREIRAATFTRPDAVIPKFEDHGDDMVEASLFDLIGAFKELLERRKVLLAHEVESEGKTVEQRIEEILALIKEGDSTDFMDLFETQRTKMDMIVTFLALLELIRLKRVKVYQKGNFGPIRIFRPVGPTETGAPAPV